MLCLSRRVYREDNDEKIIINTTDGVIEIIVTGIDGKQAKIGIKAPQEVSIYRQEILKKMNK